MEDYVPDTTKEHTGNDSESFESHEQKFEFDSLESLRKRLLDLTARNKLLNFKFSKTSQIRIIDELPDQLTELLINDSVLTFLPVSEPTTDELLATGYLAYDEEKAEIKRIKDAPKALEWAKQLGFDTSYDLPYQADSDETKHNDTAIQTLMYPPELESRLRNIRSKAVTAIEETGSNFLYIAFGFLEWYESSDSKVKRLAPLYLIPVNLEKSKLDPETRRYYYTLNYTGEDILPNLSLQEKLRIDFGLGLPPLEQFPSPETYMAAFEEVISDVQPRWSIKRQCVLTLLEFGNLLMYLDLDPENWPKGSKNITEHEIVQRFFSSANTERNSSSGSFSTEYSIDEVDEIHNQFPLIDDADSSQHSAVIDAINGKNLVIEGPPGTGKSQTITNIIAAAIAQGKTVLFVAEKLAALEVVKHRLDLANLGDFCLELHSHKTQKRKILDEINRRLVNQSSYEHPNQIDEYIERYEDLKSKLNAYVNVINSNWKSTGLTIHEILNKSVRYREKVSEHSSSELIPSNLSGQNCTSSFIREAIDNVKLYRDVFIQVSKQLGTPGEIGSHPWFGVNNTQLQVFDTDDVIKSLEEWDSELLSLQNKLDEINGEFSFEEALQGLEELTRLVDSVKKLHELSGNEQLTAIEHLSDESLETLDEFVTLTEEVQNAYQELTDVVLDEYLDDLSLSNGLQLSQQSMLDLGINSNASLPEVARVIPKLSELNSEVSKLSEIMSDLTNRLGDEFSKHIYPSIDGLAEFKKFIEISTALPTNSIKNRQDLFDDDEVDDVIDSVDKALKSLVPQFEELLPVYKIEKISTASDLESIQELLNAGGVFKWFKSTWRSARKDLLSLSVSGSANFNVLQELLPKLISFCHEHQEFTEQKKYPKALGEMFCGIDTDVEQLKVIREWYVKIRSTYGVGFGAKAGLGNSIITMPSDILKGMHSLIPQGVIEQISDCSLRIESLKPILGNSVVIQNTTDSFLSEESPSYLLAFTEKIKTELATCQQALVKPDTNFQDFAEVVTKLLSLKSLKEQWESTDVLTSIFNSEISIDVGARRDISNSLGTLKDTSSLAHYLNDKGVDSRLREAIIRFPQFEAVRKLRGLSDQIGSQLSIARDKEDAFSVKTGIEKTAWCEQFESNIQDLLQRNEVAARNPNWLSIWVDFVRFRKVIESQGFASLLDKVEAGHLDIDKAEDAMYLGIYDLLSREILTEKPDLAQFSGQRQDAIKRQFSDYDERLKALQQKRIAYHASNRNIPAGNSGGKVSTYTELSLLKHEAGKKTRHIPIRQMIKRAGNALMSIKPCFMMGPKSVAQYLPAGELEFDLIVIDEASQVKPQDALGTIARGKQFIVVGDPKQLPPTSFFDRMNGDEEDEEATGIQQSESVLSAAAPLFSMRQLRWHYRSQHEGLIAFSNHSFYDNNLVVFPSPHNESSDYGVKYHRVNRGRFVNQRNVEEARVIAESVVEHLINRSHESIGVVAMSANQREQIDRAIEEIAKENDLAQTALEQNLSISEPLFVKNLENVQGDERDVIYISCTYGPHDPEGKTMFQRFGPINSDVGWRRLNVLFTRSKKRMHVFSSMDPEHIQVTDKSSRGVRALREFLGFAKSGHIHQPQFTGKAPDSDFEVAVATMLLSYGFECEPQVGVAGFFIDLAVKDPNQPGRFLMGIECDGAAYHSAKSARDRDRLRQTVLERLGWNIQRIWSTDWFKNPEAQIKPIVDQLNQLKSEPVIDSFEPKKPSEPEHIDEIISSEEAMEVEVDTAISGDRTLEQKLKDFDLKVIQKEFPETPENKRLLRPAMLEALLHSLPMDMFEFQESIAAYLRNDTDSSEGKYLRDLLQIIAEHDDE